MQEERRAPPELAGLAAAQGTLARAFDASRRTGEAYLAAPLSGCDGARDAYVEALERQARAEDAFYEAKAALSRRLSDGD